MLTPVVAFAADPKEPDGKETVTVPGDPLVDDSKDPYELIENEVTITPKGPNAYKVHVESQIHDSDKEVIVDSVVDLSSTSSSSSSSSSTTTEDGKTTTNITNNSSTTRNDTHVEFHVKVEKPTEWYVTAAILESVNNVLPTARWRPSITELPDIKAVIAKSKEKGLVYDGWWDMNLSADTVDKSSGASRAKEILGYDITILKEDFDFTNWSYEYYSALQSLDDDKAKLPGISNGKHTITEATEVTREYAVMALYKALGQDMVQWKIHFYHHPNFYALGQPSVPIGITPFASQVTVLAEYLDPSEYYAQAFVTRSNVDLYWDRAVDESLVYKYTEENYATENAYRSVKMTWGEFCELAMDFMIRYGEPHMTEEESLYILEVFGRTLPHYLPSQQLEAVKYLLARGVITDDHNFTQPISLDECLDVLMKIKDEGSRDTFKQLTLTYDPTLLKEGYYPTMISTETIGVDFYADIDYAAATHYDYLVLKDNNTTFQDEYGNEVTTGIYVSNKYNQLGRPLAGSSYLGIVRGPDGKQYYHFRIPVYDGGAAWTKEEDGDIWVSINTRDVNDLPKNYCLEHGGGWYAAQDSTGFIRRVQPFTAEDSAAYVDVSRKMKAQESNDDISLFDTERGDYTVSIKIPAEDRDKIEIMDTTGNWLSVADAETAGLLVDDKTADRPYVYVLTGVNNLGQANARVRVKAGASASKKLYQTYAKDGDSYLVNLDYLMAIGAVYQYDWYREGELLFIQSTYNNVFIDITRNIIYTGTTVTEIDNATRLYYTDKTGAMYIDYRAVTGWAGRYLTLADEHGNVSISWKKYNRDAAPRPVYSAADSEVELGYITVSNSDAQDIVLSSSYPLANYFVYQAVDKASTTKNDYIFVFKLDNTFSQEVDDSSARKFLNTALGMELPEEWCVFYKALNRDTTRQEALEDTANRHYYYDTALQSYMYIPSEYKYSGAYATLNAEDTVYSGTLLPIFCVTQEDIADDGEITFSYSFRDVNLNVLVRGDNNAIPYGYVSESLYKTGRRGDVLTLRSVLDNTLPVLTLTPTYTIQPAPVAVVMDMLGLTEVSVSPTAYAWYYGTLPLRYQSGQVYAGSVNLTEAVGGAKFRLAFRQKLTSVYVYSDEKLVVGELTKVDTKVEVEEGDPLDYFDWDGFSAQVLLDRFDGGLSIAIIFVLNILPRVFMFIFVILIALACIARFRIVIKFCDKIFDPYKLLTLGRKDVHTISLFNIFITSMIALALFGLFQNGTILDLIAWLARAVTGILNR